MSYRSHLLRISLPVVLVVLLVGGAPLAYGLTRIVPIISATEQYDQNVFFTPKSRLKTGQQPEDFITTVIPQVVGTYTGRLVDVNTSVGALVTQYVNNPSLDYIGINGSGALNLTRLGQRSLPRLKTWSVLGTYQYSQTNSAFGGCGFGSGGAGFGGAGGAGGAGGCGVSGVAAQPGLSSPFATGQVTQRVRTTSYSVGPTASYALAPTTDFQASFMYNRIDFGSQLQQNPQGQNKLSSTSTYTISGGTSTKLTATDTLTVIYTHSSFSQQTTFNTHNGIATWTKVWSPELSSSLGGGLTLLEPYTSTNTGTPQRVPAYILPTGTASITYRSGSSFIRAAGEQGGLFGSLPTLAGTLPPGGTLGRGSYTVTLAYNVGVFPAFVGNSGALLSNVVLLESSVGLTDRLTGQGGVNFAYSTQTGATGNATFKSYGTTETLNYLFTPTLRATLTHNWLAFDQSGVATTTGSPSSFYFSKHTVLFGLSYLFGGPGRGFFMTGEFWGPSILGPVEGPGPAGPEKTDTGAPEIKR